MNKNISLIDSKIDESGKEDCLYLEIKNSENSDDFHLSFYSKIYGSGNELIETIEKFDTTITEEGLTKLADTIDEFLRDRTS